MNINLNKLRAVRKMTAKQDVRYHLNGVCVGRGVLVATNGHYLIKAADSGADYDGELIVPNDVLDAVFRKLKDRKYKALGEVELNGDGAKWQFRVGGELLEQFTPIDGKFPDWQRVIPDGKAPEEMAQFNWSYLTLFDKAHEELGAKVGGCVLRPFGDSAALVEFPGFEDVIGVCMPMRK